MLVKDVASKLADEVRQNYWGESVPVDPFAIAKELSIDVRLDPALGDDVAGVIIKEYDEDPVIYINASDSRVRQRFTCAHEIGHYIERTIVQDQPDDDFGFTDKRQSGPNDIHEFFADMFAANLLMPEHDVRLLAEQHGDKTVALARAFDVSLPAMRIRRQHLQLP